ncbi:MAG: L-aspartate oxidase [Gammaproteobacteria bacterium]|nr:L-aspartate oxidase [Gammaproteobacteria bacterium]MCZ6579085.1 L-aspartate oxidase [Gammaproteobacteria bacterium]
MSKQTNFDVVILGSGAAGLSVALHLPSTISIAILAKNNLEQYSSYFAQGGISAVLEPDDSVEQHVEDTMIAGAGLCDQAVVTFTAAAGKQSIQWLAGLGMPFTKDRQEISSSGFHLTREGGHSKRRVVHAADATGRALQQTLDAHVQERPNIKIFDQHIAIDLIHRNNHCQGLYALNRSDQHIDVFAAQNVVLATGGASKVYLYTSNPDGSTGDGIAMAWRAGCRVANMEFIQFHPTCLYHPEAKSFLISEAVRGEGGKLILPDGERFMSRFDDRAELAPRDIVARAIDHEMKRLGVDCVYLDISHKSRAFIKSHFPTIYQRCKELDIDITSEPIPVVPAAHYTCGGVMTNLSGQTDIENLYAVGEVAYTGLHGANRMASNSLLECLVFARSAAEHIAESHSPAVKSKPLPRWDESQVTDSDEDIVVAHNWDELRRFMWDYVGIVRTDKRLQRALHRAQLLKQEINDYYGNYKVSPDLLELRNLVVVAELIIRSAMQRKESRGLHFTLDYPQSADDWLSPTLLVPATNEADQLQKISLISP